MKPTLITICLVLGFFSLNAQGLREIILPFNYLQCTSFEYDVMYKIDSAYRLLNLGEKARLVLYTEQERLTQSHIQLQSLTEKRAKLVYAFLDAKKKLPISEIQSVIPFLEEEINTSTEQNDRFSDVIHRPLPGLQSVLLNKTEGNSKFYTHVGDPTTGACQQFPIIIRYETKFYTEGGVFIKIQPHSFVYENGEKLSCEVVQLCVKEYLTYNDMLSADLVTHSNGKMLETGGMVYLEATCGSRKLKLANGKTIQIIFPAEENKSGMQAFNGVKNDNISHWLLQKGGDVTFSKVELPDLNPDSERNVELEGNYDREIGYERSGSSEDAVYDSLANLYDYYYDDDIYQMTDGFLLTTANLGWINCDRFYNIEQKTELMVSSGRKEPVCYRLVFTDIRSVMPAYQYDAKGNFKFEDVPSGQQATLVAFYLSKDKKSALFGSKTITLGITKKEEIEMKEMSGDALSAMFSEAFPK